MTNRTFIQVFGIVSFFRFLNPVIEVRFLRARHFLILWFRVLLHGKVEVITVHTHWIAFVVVILLSFVRLPLRLVILSSHASRTKVKTFCHVILLSLVCLGLYYVVTIVSRAITTSFRC